MCVELSRSPKSEGTYESRVILDAIKYIGNPNDKVADDPMSVPHKLFCLEPEDKDDETGSGRMMAKAKIATPHIRRLISYAAANVESRERIRFFQTISTQPVFRSAAGVLFKRFVISWLASKSGSLDCTPARGTSTLEIPACGKDRTFFFHRSGGHKSGSGQTSVLFGPYVPHIRRHRCHHSNRPQPHYDSGDHI